MFLAPILAAALTPPAMPPQSQSETQAMREAKSIVESTGAAPKGLLTLAETSGFRRTGSYDECTGFYRTLAKASPVSKLQQIGTTSEGRPLYVLIVSKDGAFTPEAARRTGKPVVLLQNGIHAG